jgi:putative membrane protein
MMWYDGGWGSWFVMAVIMVFFWALVIAGIVALVHYFAGARHSHQSVRPSSPGSGRRQAEDLLAERFALGEIDEDEYKRRLALLREHR